MAQGERAACGNIGAIRRRYAARRADTKPAASPARKRERAEQIDQGQAFYHLDRLLLTAEQGEYLELWDSREQGEQWLRRQWRQGRVQRIGTVPRVDKRGYLVEMNAYTRGPRPRSRLHDSIVADAVILIGPERYDTRGIPPEVGADWIMWLTDSLVPCYGELHRCAGQTVAELAEEEGRFDSYRNVDVPVLWVIEGPSPQEEEARMKAMMAKAGGMRRPSFVTFTGLMADDIVILGPDGRPSCLVDG
jgi:hypothetical protein